ncbi:MAG: site-specific integrase, partial [Thermoproteota archaeon]|nr:site-specific integrase [Thermoproteota archaeon]
ASYSRINVIVSAMQAYCNAYDIEVNFDKVRRYMPEHVRKVKDRAYTKEEVRRLLEAANTRVRMLILLFVSTGMREGAVPGLKLKHLIKMHHDGCYKISLYDEDVGKQLAVFTTRECSQAIDAYLKYREVEGEVLKPESPLIRKEFSWRDANRFEPVSRNTIARLVEEVALRTGLRIKSGGKRQEVMLVHGLRKYYDTNLARANIKTLFIPILMGYSSPGLQSSYFRPTKEEIYAEYKKAADLLTISEEKHLRYEVEKLKTEVADVELMKKTYLDMKLVMESKDRELKATQQQLLSLHQRDEMNNDALAALSERLMQLEAKFQGTTTAHTAKAAS